MGERESKYNIFFHALTFYFMNNRSFNIGHFKYYILSINECQWEKEQKRIIKIFFIESNNQHQFLLKIKKWFIEAIVWTFFRINIIRAKTTF